MRTSSFWWGYRVPHLDREPTASVWCDECGAGWAEMPDNAVHVVHGCDTRCYYGPEPDECYIVCPACRGWESLVETPRWIYRATGRRKTHKREAA